MGRGVEFIVISLEEQDGGGGAWWFQEGGEGVFL